MKNNEIYEPIFTKFPDSTKVPEIFHPTKETDMKKPDIEHKLLLAEGTLEEIERILKIQNDVEIKYSWIKMTMYFYKKNKQEIETKGYLSLKTEEE